jgi:hydroxymethylbilane synthase
LSPLRIGTRGSALALWQARCVADLIHAQPDSPPVELVHIKTEGDLRTDVPLWAVGGRAFFTKEIDRALLANDIDIAVHSLKDLSTTLEAGIALAAVLEREDARDALLVRSSLPQPQDVADELPLSRVPRGARVGTSSLRRRAFLAHARSDLVLLELRGNVPTRMEKLEAGEYDAIVLATAGLIRLGLSQRISAHLPAQEFPPAVSQGAIGVCARSTDATTLKRLAPLDHAETRSAITAERALLRRIEGGCQVPLGALAILEHGQLVLSAAVCSTDGSQKLTARDSAKPACAQALGERVAEQLLAKGAARIIDHERGQRAVVDPP